MRGRLAAVMLGIVLGSTPAWAQVDESDNDVLFAAMVGLVVGHDVAIIAGLSPTPLIQYTAETVEFAANLGLKALPPWLEPPADRSIDPAQAPQDSSYLVADSGCAIQFELLSPEAEYENLFGVANFRDSYTDVRTGRVYRWQNPSAPLTTRWGFLRAPELYHANTSVTLRVRTPAAVRRFDPATGLLGEPYVPIDAAAALPQTVVLPIGRHAIQWHGATKLNWASDVVIPGALLAIGLMTELKNAYGGVKVAKQVKGVGIGEAAIREPLDPAGAARLSDGVKRYNDIWQKAWTDRQAARRDSKLRREFRKKVGCLFKDVIGDVLEKAAEQGVTVIDDEIGAALYAAGKISLAEAHLLEAVSTAYAQLRLNRTIAQITPGLSCDDPDEAIAKVIELLIKTTGLEEQVTRETKERVLSQFITVLDTVPPTIAFGATPLVLEATDLGGTRLSRAYPDLLAAAQAASSENCGRTPELRIVDAPNVLPLGFSELTWEARDRGPNPTDDGKNYAPTAAQPILVRDTQPPILLAPPSKVIEAPGDVPLGAAAIGDPAAVDLVDVQPHIGNDAPASFPLDRRTPVRWTATDGSGNSATATQLVTVKTPGSNTAPVADPATARTLTAVPVDIRLTAADTDELDGMTDPLWFKIETQPAHGEFVAPLYPFFIEDYRTKPGDGLGNGFDPATDEIYSFIEDNYCETSPQQQPPRNFVHEAQFVHVTDDGIRYVLDEFFRCDPFEDHAQTFGRFSKWNATGEFLGQVELGANREDRPHDGTFVVDRDGFLYYSTTTEPSSSSNELRLHRCTTSWPASGDSYASTICPIGHTFHSGLTPSDNEIDASTLSLARIDSDTHVAYVADGHSLFAFELLDDGGARYLGELGPKSDGRVIDGWFGAPSAIEVGSDGSVYLADELHHRIHKLGPVRNHPDDGLVPGDYIGWAGRCTGSGNKACDEVLQRSRGYSCTFEPDSCTVAPAGRAGSAQGQFDTPRFIAIDPNDVLYVADYENARIQRLAADGSFAGEAVSDGSGINKGDRPSFVIGNMGKPASVSVNSSQFFVVDRDEQFVHVFGTLPFKDIAPDAVTVTYVSKQDFPNPNITGTDAFTFSVSDGLASSAPATVAVAVDRNFRPPVAMETTLITTEDVSLDLELEADDPDGIAGKDFLGLDTLTYAITALPLHGELTGGGAEWTYRPNAGFYGEDRFTFRVNDGRDDSNEAVVFIEVTPSNDPPEVTIEAPGAVGLGFPIMLKADFRDDPAASYEARVIWGDGQSSTTGGIVDDENDPALDGVLVTEPPAPGVDGQVFAQHVYAVGGTRNVTVCLTDDAGLEGCDTLAIDVQPLVSLGFGGLVYDEPLVEDDVTGQEVLDGVPFTYELTVLNGVPSAGNGLTAHDVRLEAELPAATTVQSISTSRGSCAAVGATLVCTIGSLEPDEMAVVAVRAAGPGTLATTEARDLSGVITTTSAAIESELEFTVNVDVLPNLVDTDGDGMPDGYERAHGLDFTRDDGTEDADGDGLDNRTEFLLGTSPRLSDTDGDGLSDFAEHESGDSDPTNPDTDGDGMPDGWEVAHGLRPSFAGDADEDPDGDGLPNGGEFAQGKNPTVDDVPPLVTVPPDVTVVATGRLTRVPLGEALAVDARDGPVPVQADAGNVFAPGVNQVRWSAADALGNAAVGVQRVNVVPLATAAVDQSVAEGAVARVRVQLNGPAVTYPVSIPYTVAGTAGYPDDHAATSGVLTIASGVAGEIEVPTVLDALVDPDETVIVQLAEPINAALGPKALHTITLREGNLAPRVSVSIEQQGSATTTVARDGGVVAVRGDVSDQPGDQHTYDWSGSDAAVLDPARAAAPSFDRDPAALPAGLYALDLRVADDRTPVARGDARTVLRVIDRLPVLVATDDSDGDGIDDRTEGGGDDDGDRVPNYLDRLDASNVLALHDDGRVMETNAGLALRLGEAVFAQGASQASLPEDALRQDVDFGYPDGVADFEITGLEPGAGADVVMPLARPLPAGAVYRKLMFGVWQDFTVGGTEALASAPGTDGACPPPGSALYRAGLHAGDGCLQITLADGGPNDADGSANGVIRDPGGIGLPVAVELEVIPRSGLGARDGRTHVMFRLRLHSESGDALLRSLTLRASGSGDDRRVGNVTLLHDVDGDGTPSAGDVLLAGGAYSADDGELTLTLSSDLEVPRGTTEVLVTYSLED